MSTEIREYLEAKAAEHEREWLHREPRTTLPEIQALVAEFVEDGGFNNDAAERFIIERAGDLPEHRRHGAADRHRLIDQLGHEVYIARSVLRDQKALEALAALHAEGFAPLDESEIEDGGRYIICTGTTYSGADVPAFGAPKEMRARRIESGFMFLPRGARTRGYRISGPALVKVAA